MTRAYARTSDPISSDEAAETVPVTKLEAVCLSAIRASLLGLTSEELAMMTKLSLVTVSPRLRPLEQKGLIMKRGTSRNRSGRQAIVWKAVAQQGRLF